MLRVNLHISERLVARILSSPQLEEKYKPPTAAKKQESLHSYRRRRGFSKVHTLALFILKESLRRVLIGTKYSQRKQCITLACQTDAPASKLPSAICKILSFPVEGAQLICICRASGRGSTNLNNLLQ